MSKIAFGIAATQDLGFVADIARSTEEAGFRSLWVNDTPMADGIANAAETIESSESLQAAIGVLSVDRRPPTSVIGELRDLDEKRLIVGIGSGFSNRPLKDVRDAVAELRHGLGCRIAIAAMGPRMCELAGELADVVLLNWMTPTRVSWARDRIEVGASSAGNSPVVAAYVRVAIGSDAQELLADEVSRYANLPHYARHFESMGAAPSDIGLACSAEEVRSRLEPYKRVLDHLVVRALPASSSIEDTRSILLASAPA